MSKSVWMWITVMSLLCACHAAVADNMELQAGYNWVFPASSLWDQSTGAEFKIIEWYESGAGVAFSVGSSKWEAAESSHTIIPWNGSVGRSQTWEGDARFIPIGLSAMLRGETATDVDTKLAVELEAGFRYLLTNSHISLRQRDDVWRDVGQIDTTYTTYNTDLGNSWVGRLGLDLAWKLNDQTSLLTNLGYQFDLTKAQLSAGGASVYQDVSMNAFILQLGIAFMY